MSHAEPTPPDPQQSPYASPAPADPAYNPSGPTEGDATGGLIPYKNVPALLAYYLGIFSLIPCLGIFAAVPAFVLGIIGLRKRKQNPVIKGSAHAWIGIILGGLFTLIWGAAIAMMVVGGLANSM